MSGVFLNKFDLLLLVVVSWWFLPLGGRGGFVFWFCFPNHSPRQLSSDSSFKFSGDSKLQILNQVSSCVFFLFVLRQIIWNSPPNFALPPGPTGGADNNNCGTTPFVARKQSLTGPQGSSPTVFYMQTDMSGNQQQPGHTQQMQQQQQMQQPFQTVAQQQETAKQQTHQPQKHSGTTPRLPAVSEENNNTNTSSSANNKETAAAEKPRRFTVHGGQNASSLKQMLLNPQSPEGEKEAEKNHSKTSSDNESESEDGEKDWRVIRRTRATWAAAPGTRAWRCRASTVSSTMRPTASRSLPRSGVPRATQTSPTATAQSGRKQSKICAEAQPSSWSSEWVNIVVWIWKLFKNWVSICLNYCWRVPPSLGR